MGKLMTAGEARAETDDRKSKNSATLIRNYWDNRFTSAIRQAIREGLYEATAVYHPDKYTFEELQAFVADNNLGYELTIEDADNNVIKASWANAEKPEKPEKDK